jgi:hypothetical protein
MSGEIPEITFVCIVGVCILPVVVSLSHFSRMKKNTIGIVGLGKIGNAVARGFAGAKLDVRPQQVHPFLYFFDRHHHQQL